MHIRRMLDNDTSADLRCCFSANWVLHAYNEVTSTKRNGGKFDAELTLRVALQINALYAVNRSATHGTMLNAHRTRATDAHVKARHHRVILDIRVAYATCI
mgnify:CR=1 FL=1|tara:strand:+ start:1765 stop:2067 length:303 start_codon:yes stop_codon:yes gene_type:complete